MKNSFKLATILGIPIKINISWFVILWLIIFTLARGYFPEYLNAPELVYWIMGAVTAMLLFICLVLHELSHSIVAKRNNLSISGITLFIFGGVAHMQKEPASPSVEFKMAFAGPATSFALALFFWLVAFLSRNSIIRIIADYLFFFNSAIALFNLIPGFPLDGGRVLRAVIWHFSKNLKTATYIASSFGKGFALLLMAFGLLGFISGNLITGIWFIFLGFFLFEAAQLSYNQVVIRKALTGLKVKDIMSSNVITVPSNILLKDLIESYFFRFKHNCFPVIKDDSLLGIITFHDTKEVEKDLWGIKTSEDIMIPINSSLIISKDAPAEEALAQLVQNDAGRLLVIENDKLIGIISQRDIMKFFKFMEEMG